MISRDDLVGYALGALGASETDTIRRAVAADPALAAQLRGIERHLALHDAVPQLQPKADLWFQLKDRLEEPAARRPFVQRFWMPIAAAALVLVALYWPRSEPAPTLQRVHGNVTRTGDTFSCSTVSRVQVGEGVTLTLDSGTSFELLSSNRLALRAGRVFVDVEEARRGYTVEATGLRVVTTGTRFLVDTAGPIVGVARGSVRCEYRGAMTPIDAGTTWTASKPLARRGPDTSWFQRPTLTVRIVDPNTIRVVIRNDMPDTIQVAPPTGGEPLFFASYQGHDLPLAPDGFEPLELLPDTDKSFLMRLPRPLNGDDRLVLSYPAAGVRVEATR